MLTIGKIAEMVGEAIPALILQSAILVAITLPVVTVPFKLREFSVPVPRRVVPSAHARENAGPY